MKSKSKAAATTEQPRPQEPAVPAEELRQHARELRGQGWTFPEIAEQLGADPSAILFHLLPDYDDSLDELVERVSAIREHDFEITQLLLEALMPHVLDVQQEAFKHVMNLLERRSKYWGLDISNKSLVDPATSTTAPFESIEAMIAAIAQRTHISISTTGVADGDKPTSC